MEQKIVLEVNEEEKKIIELYRSLPLEKQRKFYQLMISLEKLILGE